LLAAIIAGVSVGLALSHWQALHRSTRKKA
jgi:hypothetical protein